MTSMKDQVAAALVAANIAPERMDEAMEAVRKHLFLSGPGDVTFTDQPGSVGSLVSDASPDHRLRDPAVFVEQHLRRLQPALFEASRTAGDPSHRRNGESVTDYLRRLKASGTPASAPAATGLSGVTALMIKAKAGDTKALAALRRGKQ